MEKPPKAIKTTNLLLRPINASDIHPVLQGLSHPEVIQYYGVSFFSLEEVKVQIDWYARIEKEQTGRWWAIVDPADEHFYGAIGIHDIHPQHRKAEIGFWLLPEYRGKGYIPEAAIRIIKHSFEYLRLHRMYAYVESENHNSKKVLTKLGFVYEGTMRECEIKDGKWIDLEIYALLQKDQG
jgi:ribosomal-protein-alanine N-acetyltransferase